MELNFKQLKAALHTAPKTDVRHYLNGVFVEVRSGFYRIVSTDGSNMSVFHNFEPECAEALDLIIPRDIIENLPKQKGLTITLKKLDGFWCLGSTLFTPIDGRYPEYRRVLPKDTNGQAAQLLHEALSLFGKTADLMVKKGAHVRVWYNGDDASAITIADLPEFMGITVPLRKQFLTKMNMDQYPTWVNL